MAMSDHWCMNIIICCICQSDSDSAEEINCLGTPPSAMMSFLEMIGAVTHSPWPGIREREYGSHTIGTQTVLELPAPFLEIYRYFWAFQRSAFSTFGLLAVTRNFVMKHDARQHSSWWRGWSLHCLECFLSVSVAHCDRWLYKTNQDVGLL